MLEHIAREMEEQVHRLLALSDHFATEAKAFDKPSLNVIGGEDWKEEFAQRREAYEELAQARYNEAEYLALAYILPILGQDPVEDLIGWLWEASPSEPEGAMQGDTQ